MMENPERMIAFLNELQSWIGTPFRKDGKVKGKGGGVDCVNLVQESLASACPGVERLTFPPYQLDTTYHAVSNALLDELDKHPQLERVYTFEEKTRNRLKGLHILPGDLLGMRIVNAVWHIGISAGNKKFVHVMPTYGTTENWLDDASFETRLLTVHRPLTTPRA